MLLKILSLTKEIPRLFNGFGILDLGRGGKRKRGHTNVFGHMRNEECCLEITD